EHIHAFAGELLLVVQRVVAQLHGEGLGGGGKSEGLPSTVSFKRRPAALATPKPSTARGKTGLLAGPGLSPQHDWFLGDLLRRSHQQPPRWRPWSNLTGRLLQVRWSPSAECMARSRISVAPVDLPKRGPS